jgi:hypothetical protein
VPAPSDSDDFSLPWRRRLAPADTLWLVIAWALEEPERLGEGAPLESGTLLGRGEPEPQEAPSQRLRFCRVRGGQGSSGDRLTRSRVSRRQLEFSEVSGESARVTALGRCPMTVNGSAVTSALLKAGDVLTLRNALVLFVARRREDLILRTLWARSTSTTA